jgi:hypothetical protein
MPFHRVRRSAWSLVAVSTALLAIGSAATAQQPDVPVQTLCVLDFHRLGDDARADWLEQGLADLMIGTMHSASPYLVVERRHLKQILDEHGLAQKGLLDIQTAVRGASLAKAQLLLQGSFGWKGDDLSIQVRLIRVSDQQVLAQGAWTGRYNDVLVAPRVLSEHIQARVGSPPLESGRLEGIESDFPTTIDVAKSYYQGVRAFDEGRYPESLAHYLDAAERAGDFRKAYSAVLEMYYLLGRSEHAVLFARDLARLREENGDVPGALEYYFDAAQAAHDPLGDLKSTSALLTQLLRVVETHERKTGEIAATKRAILKRIDDLRRTGAARDPGQILADREIRHRIWTGEIDGELERRAEEQARGGYTVREGGKWVKRSVPPPSVLMWKIRARRTLARTDARSGNIRSALDQYRALVDEYEFLEFFPYGRLLDSIRTEAHFMWLRHYVATGELIRDHAIGQINQLNVVNGGVAFKRDLSTPPLASADTRARVASRGDGQGHEYFDFAAPIGRQIDSVTLRANVDGIAEFGFNVPHPVGWPPQYSFSRRIEHFKFTGRDAYERKVVLPPGTEFFSVGTSWGPGLYSNTWADLTRRKVYASGAGSDLVNWEISFTMSPKPGVETVKSLAAQTRPAAAPKALMDKYASGWNRGYVVREAETSFYTGSPSLDVYAENWLTFAMDGNIRIFQERDPRVEIDLPVTINSRAREFDPSLVRHNGGYALLWARGTSKRNADRFVAFSDDLLRWHTPQRLVFEAAPTNIRYTYAQLEPLERTYNVVAVRGGYAMLLAQGFVRLSKNLRHWSAPRKVISQELDRNRLIKGEDGIIWAVYETSSTELQPYTDEDWLDGYFVTDGRRFRHVTELRVSRSTDGISWSEAGKVVVPGQPSGLWAFPVDEKRIGIAAGFNNKFVKWFTASNGRSLTPIDSRLELFNQSDETACFVRDGSLTCVRPLFDVEGQKPMLLATNTEELW